MVYAVLYLAGVAIGLAVMRDPLTSRIPTALMWPLGPVAFVIVIGIMLIAAAIVWPVPVLSAGLILAVFAWLR